LPVTVIALGVDLPLGQQLPHHRSARRRRDEGLAEVLAGGMQLTSSGMS
jgi:hypothetical protein